MGYWKFSWLSVGILSLVSFSEYSGAPVDWLKNPDPLVVQPATVQIAKHAPHPNSAKLSIEEVQANF